MTEKEPVLLTTLIDTSRMRWLVGAIGFDGQTYPLIRSHDDDLSPYCKLDFDEQASFLRHRMCGILQRGCDRLWGIQKKSCHFVFVLDQNFPHAPKKLTQRTAKHLYEWMANPPVTFFLKNAPLNSRPAGMQAIAGELNEKFTSTLNHHLPALLDAATDPDLWEEAPRSKA